MVQLPVFRVFGNAVRFTLWNAFTIFRLTWLPIACLVAIGILPLVVGREVFFQFYGLDDRTLDETDVSLFVGIQLALNLMQAIVMTSVAVAIHRVILFDERRPGHYFLFAFGKTEFAFFMMGVLTVTMVLGVFAAILGPIVYLLFGGDIAGAFEAFEKRRAIPLEAVGGFAPLAAGYFACWIILLFIFIRLAVWPPSVVATNSVSPAEAWSLTRGNFWRFVGLFVLAGLAMYAVIIPIVVGAYLHHREFMMSREFFDATRNLEVREQVQLAIRPVLPTLAALYFLLVMYATAFLVAIVSFAYRALKGVEAGASIGDS